MRNAVRSYRGTGLLIVVALAGVPVMLSMGCGSKKPQPQWPQLAQSAKMLREDAIHNVKRELGALPEGQRQRTEKLLDELSAVERSDAGVRSATATLTAALPGFADPSGALGSEDASVAKVKLCALVLMHGLIELSGEKVAQQASPDAAAVALVSAVREIQLFGRGNAASLLSEVRVGLGPALYSRAIEKLDAQPSPPALPPVNPSADKASP